MGKAVCRTCGEELPIQCEGCLNAEAYAAGLKAMTPAQRDLELNRITREVELSGRLARDYDKTFTVDSSHPMTYTLHVAKPGGK